MGRELLQHAGLAGAGFTFDDAERGMATQRGVDQFAQRDLLVAAPYHLSGYLRPAGKDDRRPAQHLAVSFVELRPGQCAGVVQQAGADPAVHRERVGGLPGGGEGPDQVRVDELVVRGDRGGKVERREHRSRPSVNDRQRARLGAHIEELGSELREDRRGSQPFPGRAAPPFECRHVVVERDPGEPGGTGRCHMFPERDDVQNAPAGGDDVLLALTPQVPTGCAGWQPGLEHPPEHADVASYDLTRARGRAVGPDRLDQFGDTRGASGPGEEQPEQVAAETGAGVDRHTPPPDLERTENAQDQLRGRVIAGAG